MNKLRKLPKGLTFKAVLFADGAKRYYLQQYRNEEYGVNLVVKGHLGKNDQTQILTMDGLEGEFKDYEELCAAIDKYNASL